MIGLEYVFQAKHIASKRVRKMVEVLICKKIGFWDRKLFDGNAETFLKEGIDFDGQHFEVRRLTVEHGDKAGDYIYAIEPGLAMHESQLKRFLGIRE